MEMVQEAWLHGVEVEKAQGKEAMTEIGDPIVYCHRCMRPGAVAYKGWQLLCPRCIRSDEDWYAD